MGIFPWVTVAQLFYHKSSRCLHCQRIMQWLIKLNVHGWFQQCVNQNYGRVQLCPRLLQTTLDWSNNQSSVAWKVTRKFPKQCMQLCILQMTQCYKVKILLVSILFIKYIFNLNYNYHFLIVSYLRTVLCTWNKVYTRTLKQNYFRSHTQRKNSLITK